MYYVILIAALKAGYIFPHTLNSCPNHREAASIKPFKKMNNRQTSYYFRVRISSKLPRVVALDLAHALSVHIPLVQFYDKIINKA